MAAEPEPPLRDENPTFTIETTHGTMKGQLFPNEAPKTVENFARYAKDGFYEGLLFHRVIKGFVLQGGGHEPSGRQKPTRDPIKLEIGPNLVHWDGTLSMARTMDPHSATSQFFVCDGRVPHLDKQYAVFGIVTEGHDVIRKIAAIPTDRADRPKDDVIIKKLTVKGA